MESARVIRCIYREYQDWRQSGDGPEVKWTCRGLERALDLVHDLAKEERIKAEEHRPRLPIALTKDLYGAVIQALSYLNQGDRVRAVKILQKAKEDALVERRKPHELE